MKRSVETLLFNDFNNQSTFDFEAPKQCPRCRVSTNDDAVISIYFPHGKNSNFDVICVTFFCTACESWYVADYYVPKGSIETARTISSKSSEAISLFPYPNDQIDFNENIKSMSPNFAEIYRQSLQAESLGLNEICGMGYRKALEFLVKDYAIFVNRESEKNIINMQLSPAIHKYIDNPRIKTLATASTWLGNDETHYQRKHLEYDVSHLKSFINATVSFINSDLEVLKAEKLLSNPKNN